MRDYLNINELKLDFTDYLKSKGEISDEKNSSDTVSIFMHADEFKEYLKTELKFDISVCYKSINEILNMQIVDGKLVDKDKLQDAENENLNKIEHETDVVVSDETQQNDINDLSEKIDADLADEIQTNQTQDSAETNLLFDIFNELLTDENFLNAIDKDLNSEISNEELENFFNTIKSFDYDDSDISLNDILAAVEKINDSTFDELTSEELPQEKIENSKMQSTAPTGYNSSYPNSIGDYTKDNTPEEKTLDNMTKEELTNELTTAQNDLTTKKNALTSILDGSNAVLSQLQANIDASYNLYLSELNNVDENMAQQVDALKVSIDLKEDEIIKKDIEILNQESAISISETTYNNAVSTREVLESTLSTLKQVDTSNFDESQKSEISQKISNLESEIQAAKTNEQNAKTDLDSKKTELENLNTQKEDLKSGEGGLDELNLQMTELENEIQKKYPQIQEYLDAYKLSKQEYDTQKETMLSTAKTELETSQSYVNDVQKALNNSENREKALEFSFDGLTDLTKTAIELAYSQLGVSETEGENRGDNEKYGAGAGVAWCAAFVSWLFGEGQNNSGNNPLKFTSSVSGLREQAQAAGYYSKVGTYTPKPGDIMIQKSNGASHTGIVVKVEGDTIYTIEGNTSDAVRERQYTVGSNSHGKISGWIRMNEWSAAV